MKKTILGAYTGARACGRFCVCMISATIALCGVVLGVSMGAFVIPRVSLEALMSNPASVIITALFVGIYLAAVLMVLGLALLDSVHGMSADLRRGVNFCRQRVHPLDR